MSVALEVLEILRSRMDGINEGNCGLCGVKRPMREGTPVTCLNAECLSHQIEAAVTELREKDATETPSKEKITIPENWQGFCQAVGELARQWDLEQFRGTFTPPYADPWGGDIEFFWRQGRHGAESDHVSITSSVRVVTKLGPPPARPYGAF